MSPGDAQRIGMVAGACPGAGARRLRRRTAERVTDAVTRPTRTRGAANAGPHLPHTAAPSLSPPSWRIP